MNLEYLLCGLVAKLDLVVFVDALFGKDEHALSQPIYQVEILCHVLTQLSFQLCIVGNEVSFKDYD